MRRNQSVLGKRVFDLVMTLLVMPVVLPVMGLLALAVWAIHGGPVLFIQQRPGLHGRPFFLMKFRTMRNAYGSDGQPLPDAERLTAFGEWLRSSSLDELPELFNVLKGEMSLVGPRPLLMEYLEQYTPDQQRRHDVMPGITGWVQVNGRNALSWDEKFALDLWYVEHWSFLLDLWILLSTGLKVLTREGINQPGHATAEHFRNLTGGRSEKSSDGETGASAVGLVARNGSPTTRE